MARLELLGDAVIVLEAVREDSGIARMISDGSRYRSWFPLVLMGIPCVANALEASVLCLAISAYRQALKLLLSNPVLEPPHQQGV